MKINKLATLFFVLALLVALHQYVNWGIWFEIKDIHHEMFIVMFTFAGSILLYLSKKRRIP